jgi:non-specific serine/threonine protein kinase
MGLDGLPLAIELAAARAESISITEIAARLGERFDLLTEGRSGTDRHRTLQRAVEWSYSLLDESERRVFDRLSVLAGTFSLRSVEALTDLDDGSSGSALDRFAALVTGSLVARAPDARYRMLETMKAFGRAQLELRGELDVAELRRAQHYADVAIHQSNRLRTPDFADAWHRMDQEMDDFRQAFRWSVDHDRIDLAFDLTRPQWSLVFAGSRHHFHEGSEWRARLLEMDPIDRVKSRLLAEQAFVAFFLGDQLGAVKHADRSRAIEGRDSATETLALQVLALCAATNQQTDRAIELAERAIDMGGDELDAHGLESLTFAHLFGGNPAEAVRTAELVVSRAHEQGYPLRRIRALALLGAALQPIDLERSLAVLDESVAITEELGMEWDLAGAVMARGGTHLLRRDIPRAIADLGWACELTHSVRDLRRLAQTLELLGQVAGGNGYATEAVELLSAAQSLRTEIGVVGDSAKSAERAAMLTEFGSGLPPQLRARAGTRGGNASVAEAAKAGMAIAALLQSGIAGGEPAQ